MRLQRVGVDRQRSLWLEARTALLLGKVRRGATGMTTWEALWTSPPAAVRPAWVAPGRSRAVPGRAAGTSWCGRPTRCGTPGPVEGQRPRSLVTEGWEPRGAAADRGPRGQRWAAVRRWGAGLRHPQRNRTGLAQRPPRWTASWAGGGELPAPASDARPHHDDQVRSRAHGLTAAYMAEPGNRGNTRMLADQEFGYPSLAGFSVAVEFAVIASAPAPAPRPDRATRPPADRDRRPCRVPERRTWGWPAVTGRRRRSGLIAAVVRL